MLALAISGGVLERRTRRWARFPSPAQSFMWTPKWRQRDLEAAPPTGFGSPDRMEIAVAELFIWPDRSEAATISLKSSPPCSSLTRSDRSAGRRRERQRSDRDTARSVARGCGETPRMSRCCYCTICRNPVAGTGAQQHSVPALYISGARASRKAKERQEQTPVAEMPTLSDPPPLWLRLAAEEDLVLVEGG